MPMSDIIQWVLLAIAALFGIAFGTQKAKANKANKAKQEAEVERDMAKLQVKLERSASQIKDELVVRQKGNDGEMEEVIQSINSIPESKEVPLSDEIKQMAAEQVARSDARARARAERVQDD